MSSKNLIVNSKVSRIGLGSEILDMRRRGFSISRICDMMALSHSTVKSWLDKFDSLPAEEQRELVRLMDQNSVFNLKDNMEKLFRQTQAMADLVEDNPELYGKYIAEQRKQVAMAADILERAEKLQMHKIAIQTILNVLGKVDDSVRKLVLKELENNPDIKGFLT